MLRSMRVWANALVSPESDSFSIVSWAAPAGTFSQATSFKRSATSPGSVGSDQMIRVCLLQHLTPVVQIDVRTIGVSAMFGYMHGMGMSVITFDWAQIA